MARNLKQLTVFGIDFGQQDYCRDLPAALAPLTSLHTLRIRRFGDVSEYMLPLLQALPFLRILDVGDVFGCNGRQHVASWAPALRNLKQLKLWSSLTLHDAQTLVPHVTHLEALHLSKFMLSSRYWEHAQAVSFLRSAMPASCRLKFDCNFCL
jgi:hypothetical protein